MRLKWRTLHFCQGLEELVAGELDEPLPQQEGGAQPEEVHQDLLGSLSHTVVRPALGTGSGTPVGVPGGLLGFQQQHCRDDTDGKMRCCHQHLNLCAPTMQGESQELCRNRGGDLLVAEVHLTCVLGRSCIT